MGIALSKVAMVKSTGPDLEKVVDTIEVFGDEFDYLVTAYPPFLKHVVDALDERGFDWERTRVYGAVGGEGMTEAMRDHLERRLVKVRSGYGASDIQVGIAGETDLSVWVRKLLVERTDAREALLGSGETRIPMVFQYNPLENYIEVNEAGDAVVTLNNSSVLSPKLRYNVGDEGLTLTRADVVRRLGELGLVDGGMPLPQSWAAPFFFLFGRRDGTISYMGANIYPIDVEYGLYRDDSLAAAIESFCIELEESPDARGEARRTRPGPRGRAARARGSGRAAAGGARRLPGLRESRLRRSASGGPCRRRHRARPPRPRHRAVRRHGREDQERLRHPPIVKTTDLSKVPPYGRANAVFVGATQYSGFRPLLAHWPKWIRLRRRLKQAPGFCGHYVYYKFPFTFGQVVLFEEMDQLLRFARNKLHRELMAWIVEGDGRNAKAGFVRLYDARPGASYANGLWSADGAQGYDERFSALSKETEGPYVHPRKKA